MDRARATAEEMETPRSPTARVLESANIRVEVVPELGGKFISLRSKTYVNRMAAAATEAVCHCQNRRWL